MKVIRWILFLPVLVAIFYVFNLITIGAYHIFNWDNRTVTVGIPIFLSAKYLISTFLGTTISCFVAPTARIRIAMIYFTMENLFLVFMLRNLPSSSQIIIPLIFVPIGIFLSILFLRSRENRERIAPFFKRSTVFMIFSFSFLLFDIIIKTLIPIKYAGFSIGLVAGLLFSLVYLILISLRMRRRNQMLAD